MILRDRLIQIAEVLESDGEEHYAKDLRDAAMLLFDQEARIAELIYGARPAFNWYMWYMSAVRSVVASHLDEMRERVFEPGYADGNKLILLLDYIELLKEKTP